jgi:hypothetical protein
VSDADFLTDDALRVQFPGPFEQHEVVVDGWKVPLLHAQIHDGGSITLVLDGRFGLEVTTADAEAIVPFIANTIAVALGYNAHPSADDEVLPAPTPHPKPQRTVLIAGWGTDGD